MSVRGRLADIPCCLKHVSEGPILLQKASAKEVNGDRLAMVAAWDSGLAPALRRAAAGSRDAGRDSFSIPGGQWR
jgi:hypothetical protein